MSDTASRSPVAAMQMLADALLRNVGGASALLRVTGSNSSSDQAEVGLIATTFSEIEVSPVVMRRLRPTLKSGAAPQWEMLISATSIESQVKALDLPSAQSLLGMTLAVALAGKDYLIESVAANEAFGVVYLYRLILCEASQHSL